MDEIEHTVGSGGSFKGQFDVEGLGYWGCVFDDIVFLKNILL